jgi:hypothetical protein
MNYDALFTASGKRYVEYPDTQEQELYDLSTDPYELTNSLDPGATPPSNLVFRLQALKTCAGRTCRTAENGP